MGKEWSERHAGRRLCRVIRSFWNELQRFVAAGTPSRQTDAADARRQELSESGPETLQQRLEQHRARRRPQLVITVGWQRKDGITGGIRRQLPGSRLV